MTTCIMKTKKSRRRRVGSHVPSAWNCFLHYSHKGSLDKKLLHKHLGNEGEPHRATYSEKNTRRKGWEDPEK